MGNACTCRCSCRSWCCSQWELPDPVSTLDLAGTPDYFALGFQRGSVGGKCQWLHSDGEVVTDRSGRKALANRLYFKGWQMGFRQYQDRNKAPRNAQ